MYKNRLYLLLLSAIFIFSACNSNNNNDSNFPDDSNESASGIVRSNVIVANEQTLISHYYGATGTAEEGKHVLFLQNDLGTIETNSTIVFGQSSAFRNGLIRKVEAVEKYGDVTKVISTQAALDDIFEEANIPYTQALKPMPILQQGVENLGATEAIQILAQEDGVDFHPSNISNSDLLEGKRGLDFTIDFHEVDLGHGVTLNGSVDLSLSFHMKISFHTKCTHHTWGVCTKWKHYLGHTYFYIEPEESGEVTLASDDTLSFKKEKNLGTYRFPSIDIQVGIVPVVVVPILHFKVNAKGELVAGMSTGFTEDIVSKVGIEHSRRHKSSSYYWHGLHSLRHHFTMIPPYFDASATAKVSTGPELELLIYDVTGPTATLDAYLRAEADIYANPWWTLYGGIEANAGYTLEVLGHELADITLHIYDFEKDLADAGGVFP